MARDTTGFEKAYGLKGKKRVLFVVQISTRKGVDTLVRAIDLLVYDQGRDDLIFLFIGDGDYRDSARDLARSYHIDRYVRFPG